MPSAIRNLAFLVIALALMIPAAALAGSKISGSYQGKAKSLDGSTTFGTAKFVFSKDKLLTFQVTKVAQKCGSRDEKMNYGFFVADNVLKSYGLKSSDVKLKNRKLKFTYTQPSHTDKIKVSVDFSKKSPTGTVVQTASSAEKSTLNCEGSAKFTLKKK